MGIEQEAQPTPLDEAIRLIEAGFVYQGCMVDRSTNWLRPPNSYDAESRVLTAPDHDPGSYEALAYIAGQINASLGGGFEVKIVEDVRKSLYNQFRAKPGAVCFFAKAMPDDTTPESQ